MRRYELTDEQYAVIAPYLPATSQRNGRTQVNYRRVLNGMFWKLRSDTAWSDIPKRYGSWKTIYERHRHWCQEGRFAQILAALRAHLDATDQLHWEQWWAESARIRAKHAATEAQET